MLTIPATVLMVVSMSTKSWVIGHLQMNKEIVARISPWYLCVNQCLTSEHDKLGQEEQATTFKGLKCFWMRDWSVSGFGRWIGLQLCTLVKKRWNEPRECLFKGL